MAFDLPKFEERAARWANILSVIPGSYCAYALWDQRHTGGTSPLSQYPGFTFCVIATFGLICLGGLINFIRRANVPTPIPPLAPERTQDLRYELKRQHTAELLAERKALEQSEQKVLEAESKLKKAEEDLTLFTPLQLEAI
jgi:hypothetical protein